MAISLVCAAIVETVNSYSDDVPRIAISWIDEFVFLIPLSGFEVAWHRAILLDERVRFSSVIRFGAREVRYLGLSVAYAALSWWPMLFESLESRVDLFEWPLLISSLTPLVAMILFIRLFALYPAIALEHQGMTFARVWQLSAGNSLRLAGGFLLGILPVVVATYTLYWMAGLLEDYEGNLWMSSLQVLAGTVVGFAFSVFVAGFLSYAYRATFEGREPTSTSQKR